MMKKINQSQISIRPVRPEDVEAVARVEARCFPAAEAATAEEFAGRIDAFGDCFFVLEHEHYAPTAFHILINPSTS